MSKAVDHNLPTVKILAKNHPIFKHGLNAMQQDSTIPIAPYINQIGVVVLFVVVVVGVVVVVVSGRLGVDSLLGIMVRWV